MRLGGTTSIDVTKPGIDKAYGIRKLRDILGIALMRWFSLATPCSRAETTIRLRKPESLSFQVRGPDETKRVIEAIIACLDGVRGAAIPLEGE